MSTFDEMEALVQDTTRFVTVEIKVSSAVGDLDTAGDAVCDEIIEALGSNEDIQGGCTRLLSIRNLSDEIAVRRMTAFLILLAAKFHPDQHSTLAYEMERAGLCGRAIPVPFTTSRRVRVLVESANPSYGQIAYNRSYCLR